MSKEEITAEEFYRNKFRNLHKMSTEFSLSIQSVNLEVAMRWAKEFSDLIADHQTTQLNLELGEVKEKLQKANEIYSNDFKELKKVKDQKIQSLEQENERQLMKMGEMTNLWIGANDKLAASEARVKELEKALKTAMECYDNDIIMDSKIKLGIKTLLSK